MIDAYLEPDCYEEDEELEELRRMAIEECHSHDDFYPSEEAIQAVQDSYEYYQGGRK